MNYNSKTQKLLANEKNIRNNDIVTPYHVITQKLFSIQNKLHTVNILPNNHQPVLNKFLIKNAYSTPESTQPFTIQDTFYDMRSFNKLNNLKVLFRWEYDY